MALPSSGSPLLNYSFDIHPNVGRSSSPTQFSLPASLSDTSLPRTSSRPCTACKEVHVACDKQRPCGRCRRLKKEAQCEDPPARRGRKEPGSNRVRHSSSERSSGDDDSPNPSPSPLRTPPVPDVASPPSAPLRISQPLGEAAPGRGSQQGLRLSQPLNQVPQQPSRPIARASSSGVPGRNSTPPPQHISRSSTPTSSIGYGLQEMAISDDTPPAVPSSALANRGDSATAVVDGGLQIISASREFCRTLGYDLREMLGLELNKLHPPDLAAGYTWYMRIFVEETPEMQLLTSRMIELVWQTREGKELNLITRFDLFIKSRKVYSINVTLVGPATGRHAPRTEHRAIYPPQLLSLQQHMGSASQTAAAWLPQQHPMNPSALGSPPAVYNGQAVLQQQLPRIPSSAANLDLNKAAAGLWHPSTSHVVPPLPPLPPPSTVTEDEMLPWEAMIKGI